MIDIHIKINKGISLLIVLAMLLISLLFLCGFTKCNSNKYNYHTEHLYDGVYCFYDDKYNNEYLVEQGGGICPRYKYDFNSQKGSK